MPEEINSQGNIIKLPMLDSGIHIVERKEYDYKKLYEVSLRCEALYSAIDPGFLKLVRQWGFAQVSEIMANQWQDQIETYQEFLDVSSALTERELLHIYELSDEELKSRAGL